MVWILYHSSLFILLPLALRVQYGHSDERVYRLVGLLDSIPTIDMVRELVQEENTN